MIKEIAEKLTPFDRLTISGEDPIFQCYNITLRRITKDAILKKSIEINKEIFTNDYIIKHVDDLIKSIKIAESKNEQSKPHGEK